MEKRGVIDENTPVESGKQPQPGEQTNKEAADRTSEHITARMTEAAAQSSQNTKRNRD